MLRGTTGVLSNEAIEALERQELLRGMMEVEGGDRSAEDGDRG